MALLALRFDSELQAQGDQIARLLNQQERQVDLLRIICTAVVHTDTERRACEFAGGSR